MVSMNLQGRFQNVSLARKEADGTISQSCVNDLESAADFFEIDPALLGISAPVSKAELPPPNCPFARRENGISRMTKIFRPLLLSLFFVAVMLGASSVGLRDRHDRHLK